MSSAHESAPFQGSVPSLLRKSVVKQQQPLPCWCATGPTTSAGRTHVFWQYPVATAVIKAELQRCLPTNNAPAITQPHPWFLHTPMGTVNQGVWDVVALAALNAIWRAQRYACKLHLTAREQQQQQQPGRPHAAENTRLTLVCIAAVEHFWSELNSFTCLYHNKLPRAWTQDIITPTHPYITIITNARGQDCLRVVRPA